MSLLRSDRGGVGGPCAGVLVASTLFAMIGTARAGVVTLVSQTRFVDVNTSGAAGVVLPPSEQRIDAPDFGPFNQSVFPGFFPPQAPANETVGQNSSFDLSPGGNGLEIDACGTLFSGVSSSGLHGTDHFQVSFSLTAPEPYSLCR